MFRMMLAQVFGCRTYTKYFNAAKPHDRNPDIRKPTGQTPLPGPWEESYGPMSQDQETYLVKTHDGPEDEGKAIYIVRNGFAAIRSYKSYLADYEGEYGGDYSLEQIILGQPQFRSWGWNLDAWNPLDRPNTLLLKYEDLVERPDEQFPKVAAFIGLTQQAAWVNEFDKLHEKNPKMFRQGHGGDPRKDFTEAQQQLFWAVHGDWMLKLGYCTEIPAGSNRVLREVVAARPQPPPAVAAPAAATNGNGHAEIEAKYKHLKKHWWTKLGRKVGALTTSK